MLITARELHEVLQSDPDGVRVFDCRHRITDPQFGRAAYAEGHIPGAVFAHLDEDLSGEIIPGVTGRHPLPDPKHFADFLRKSGVDDSTSLVAYDDLGGSIAARFWWMARWIGLKKVAVLDGGMPEWERQGYPLSIEPAPTRSAGEFDWKTNPNFPVVTAADVMAALQEDVVIVDARSTDRFAGENEVIDPVAGHIPGAVSLPSGGNLDDAGRFLEPTALKERFGPVASAGNRVISYCGSGVTAAHNVFAMVRAGLPAPALYAGSWSDWITDPRRPVETGRSAE